MTQNGHKSDKEQTWNTEQARNRRRMATEQTQNHITLSKNRSDKEFTGNGYERYTE